MSNFMAEIAAHRMAIKLVNGRLKISGKGTRPPADFIEQLRSHRDEIIAELDQGAQGRGASFPTQKNMSPLVPFRENGCFVDFTERVAILIESGGHPPDAAQRLATNELGGEQLDLWRYHIERQRTATTIEATQLLKAATAFLSSPMAAMAAYYCWDDWEVFGVLNGPTRAMVRRHDVMGLVPALAWSRIGSKLVDIDDQRAIIETYTGNTLTHKRPLTGRRYAVPVWWSEVMKEKQNDR